MNRSILLILPILLSGCMATDPPVMDQNGFLVRKTREPRVPNHPEDIEKMLRQQREPILDDILDSDISYSQPRSRLQVSLGMPKRNVQLNLGSPVQVEVAGNPKYGNERWTYEVSTATANGYVTQRKYIYFEDHQVVGWELD